LISDVPTHQYHSKAKGGMLTARQRLGDDPMNYSNAPIRDKKNFPFVDPHAVPLDVAIVHDRRVIRVEGAMYRNAVFDGTFLLSNTVVLPFKKLGKQRVKVECCWHGYRLLKTNEPSFLIDVTTAVVDENFDGEVFTNLGKRRL
jgi:hypothetical protein